jgi:hypothetical protein
MEPEPAMLVPASTILEEVQAEIRSDQLTVDWLIGRLHNSFALVLLLLALAAVAPGINVLAGVLLIIFAYQMIAGYPTPAFPRWIAARTLGAGQLNAVLRRAIPALRWLEKSIRPRWSLPPSATKPVVGLVVMLLALRLLLTPIPLSNIPPALLIALISLAYLEQDGLTLSVGVVAALAVLVIDLEVIGKLIG